MLASGLAHDFNNILVAVRGSAELALASVEDASLDAALTRELSANLDDITRSVDRAAKLTHKLLIAGRQQAIEELELEAAVNDVLPLLTKLVGQAGVALEFQPQAAPARLHADLGQLEQLLLNLCVNARDASSSGDTITIETATVAFDDAFVADHPWAAVGRFACVRVHDRGIGMDAEVRARLFDPFFTTKSVDAGTGLGMSVVMGVVEQHEGLIEVTSERGAGTQISVDLPLAPSSLRARASDFGFRD